jgi:AraC-like DNA-binding protein
MTGAIHSDQDFTRRITEIIEANLSNDQFGVSELAHKMNMQRSTLHRKVKRIFSFSVSQFITHVRLKKALEILQKNSLTVSETAYECGFHSVTYFTKCFHDFYGFAPGTIKRQLKKNEDHSIHPTLSPVKLKRWLPVKVWPEWKIFNFTKLVFLHKLNKSSKF